MQQQGSPCPGRELVVTTEVRGKIRADGPLPRARESRGTPRPGVLPLCAGDRQDLACLSNVPLLLTGPGLHVTRLLQAHEETLCL